MAHHAFALAVLALALLLAVAAPRGADAGLFDIKPSGDATYYGTGGPRGFGHCSLHFNGFGTAPAYKGAPLAINHPQYDGTKSCGLCVKYRSIGSGSGGNPVPGDWQQGFICDECPECKYGDLDQQLNGDGRWRIEWFATQCDIGSSTLMYGYQGGNNWYRKMQVANARVPVESVSMYVNGGWQQLVATIDNFFEYHGEVGAAWAPCARVKVTSILGDSVEDNVCCSSGQCTGSAQFPCNPGFPGCDGGSGGGGGGGSSAGSTSVGGGDASAQRRASIGSSSPSGGKRSLGEQCGGAKFGCKPYGCADKQWARCGDNLKCVRNDAAWWGCKRK